MDPGAPGLAASARSGCRAGRVQPCRSSNHVTVRPPRRRQPQPSATFRLTTAGPQLRHPRPPRPVTSTRTTPPAARTAAVTVSPFAPEPLCRTLFPNSSPAAPRHPRTDARPEHPGREPPGHPRPLRPPATVTLSRTTARAIIAPAFPARPRPGNRPGPQPDTRGCTPDSAARIKPGNAADAARPWPSVEQPTVRTDRDEARIPSAMRPWTPRHAAPQRYKTTQRETEKKRPA
jgi:hypothetical protein